MRLMKYYQMKPLKNSMMEKCWEGENHPILTAKIHSPKMNKEDKNNKKNKEKKRGKDNKSMSNIEQPKQKILKQNLTMSIPIKKWKNLSKEYNFLFLHPFYSASGFILHRKINDIINQILDKIFINNLLVSEQDPMFQNANMEYRYVGNSGLQVSALSFGNWSMEDNYENNLALIKKCL